METLAGALEFVTDPANWWGGRGLVRRTWAHVQISVVATAIAAVLSLPAAVLIGRSQRAAMRIGRSRRGAGASVTVVNLARSLPSFAVLVLVVPFSIAWGFGLGFWPTTVALVLLGVPPIFANTYLGMITTDASVLEAADAAGMTPAQRLRSVELPHAAPLALTGLRVATVQIIATATLGAFVGYQALGSYIVEGLALGSRGTDRLIVGAVAVALLAVLAELAFGLAERRLLPWNRRSSPGLFRRRLRLPVSP
jgi:osmoprotectant transport system permease protein